MVMYHRIWVVFCGGNGGQFIDGVYMDNVGYFFDGVSMDKRVLCGE